MRQLFLLFIIFICHSFSVIAQNNTDYNIKGDEALASQKYYDACMWYEEGLSKCDMESIYRLTDLWETQESMQSHMNRTIMKKCFECLEKEVDAGNKNAMLLLSKYYKVGITVAADSIEAENLKNKAWDVQWGENNAPSHVDTVIKIVEQPVEVNPKTPFYKDFEFFIAYTPSYTMPFGATAGVLNDGKIGGYVSFRSNFNKQTTNFNCTNSTVFVNYLETNIYPKFDEGKARYSNFMFSAGALLPLLKQGFLSLGAGYGKRDLYWHVTEYGLHTDVPQNSFWCHNTESSYNGIVLELGGIFRYKHFLFSGGCNTISLKDLDVSVGVGFIF